MSIYLNTGYSSNEEMKKQSESDTENLYPLRKVENISYELQQGRKHIHPKQKEDIKSLKVNYDICILDKSLGIKKNSDYYNLAFKNIKTMNNFKI